MSDRVLLFDPNALPSGLSGVAAEDLARLVSDHADAGLACFRGDQIVAQCALWWTQSPRYAHGRLGAIGHFSACDRSSAATLLNGACAEIGSQGCRFAVGPMDGNTWRRYRFVSEAGDQPPFFLEPENPREYPGFFIDSGFQPLATYTSALTENLLYEDKRAEEHEARFRAEGLSLEPIDPAQFEKTLAEIHALSLVSFQNNFLYTPIDVASFLAMYTKIRPVLRPSLVILARHEGRLVGYVFGVPDMSAPARGLPIDTAIIKTLAIDPARRFAGLGSVLLRQVHRAASALGMKRAIHALMHENNRSRILSGRSARTFRRYTLYSRDLDPNGASGSAGVGG